MSGTIAQQQKDKISCEYEGQYFESLRVHTVTGIGQFSSASKRRSGGKRLSARRFFYRFFWVTCEEIFTTEWAMILRSPAENKNGGLSFHRVPSSTRHSRPVEYGPKLHGGNPGLLRRISLDTRFRGYDGTQAGLLVLIPKRVFSKEDTKSTKEETIM